MSRYFIIVLVFCISNFAFGINLIDLENIDFYRSLEKEDLLFIIRLLEREKYLNPKDELFTYVDLANQALSEKSVYVFSDNDELDDVQGINSLKRTDSYHSTKLVLKASRELNILVYFDEGDGFLKTLDGRHVGVREGNFVILDHVSLKGYDDVANEHSTIEIYEKSISNPDFSKLVLDKLGFFVYVGELNKKIYVNDISKLSKNELLFLFYELFPISRLKGIKDWYEFGFKSILREVKKVYNVRINSRKVK
ncbi:hypothetical protein [Borrelia persica]|uniref:hypothetical protein n=1 Tax=Borrelia persica TaxID=44448 RepID=UPI00046540C9|nr:hypothetical protein [Borrelia persica]